jgi:hypothetical protein
MLILINTNDDGDAATKLGHISLFQPAMKSGNWDSVLVLVGSAV